MSEEQLVSVVIPTFNRPDHLRCALASALKQKGVSLDIIIVDDASEHDLSKELAKYPQVTYLRNKKNMGGGYSRNRGLEKAKGIYINFLDDDDEFLPGKLIKQIRQFDLSNIQKLGMVSCHLRDLRSGKEVLLQNKCQGDIYKESLQGFTVNLTTSMLFKTEAVRQIGGFDETLPANQEYDLVIRLSKHYNVDYVDEVLARANRSAGQIHTNFDKKQEGARQLFKKFDNEYRRMGWSFYVKIRLKRLFLLLRFWIGKHFGEKAYRMLLRQ